MSYPGPGRVTKQTTVMLAPSQIRAELERCHEESFGWALACCHWDESEAKETLQVSYLKVLEGRARFGGGSAFKTWLFAVIRRTAGERRRRRTVRGLALLRLAEEPAPVVQCPDALASEAADARRLRSALPGLARRQREVLHLVFYGGLTIEESAEVMGVSLGSARTHYARGKQRLRLRLAEEEGA